MRRRILCVIRSSVVRKPRFSNNFPGENSVFSAAALLSLIIFLLLSGCLLSPAAAVTEDAPEPELPAADVPGTEETVKEAETGEDEDPFTLRGFGSAFVFAVPDPVLFWNARESREIQVQVSDSSGFADGAILLDMTSSSSSLRLNLNLDESSVLFLRARRLAFFGGGEWTPVVRISYKPLEIAMKPVNDYEMAVYEMTNELLAEIINRLLPGQEILVSGGVIQGKDGMPYLGLENLNYGFQFGLELLRGEERPEAYALVPKRGREKHPAVGISWYGAAFICNALSLMFGYQPAYPYIGPGVTADRQSNGFRMPAESEWDYAARGSGAFVYPGGAKTLNPRSANYLRSGDPFETITPGAAGGPTNPVDFYDGAVKNGYQTADGVSPAGLYDMMGNVWEWCDDFFVTEKAEVHKDDSAATNAKNAGTEESGGEENPPQTPEQSHFRVVRGAAWNTRHADVSLQSRGWYKAEGFSYSLGLRLSRTPETARAPENETNLSE
jgi:formylglycine-generating enzyme required for sulfatase activity